MGQTISKLGGGYEGEHAESALLVRVRHSNTIEAGLSTMRSGIASQLFDALGPQITQAARNYPQSGEGKGIAPGTPGQGVNGGQSGIPAGLDLAKLNQLYMGLVSDDEAWSAALTANTPQATAEQTTGTTASRTAFA